MLNEGPLPTIRFEGLFGSSVGGNGGRTDLASCSEARPKS